MSWITTTKTISDTDSTIPSGMRLFNLTAAALVEKCPDGPKPGERGLVILESADVTKFCGYVQPSELRAKLETEFGDAVGVDAIMAREGTAVFVCQGKTKCFPMDCLPGNGGLALVDHQGDSVATFKAAVRRAVNSELRDAWKAETQATLRGALAYLVADRLREHLDGPTLAS
jgi:hypothetical protein